MMSPKQYALALGVLAAAGPVGGFAVRVMWGKAVPAGKDTV